MTTLATTTAPSTDADLITASRHGDRRAFGQIVAKYQAMVSGLVYAACGDLHRSEDVAQETFISAWKSLSGLRDAAKLPGWLCQIARRRLADAARSSSNKEIPFNQAFATNQEPAAPADDPLKAEEAEILWLTLSRIPQPYRETLVLFYRQEQSTAQVAAAMETTEASVRQRLTRGREMLREEVAGLLERNIARTAPNPKFTSQVVAALPALIAQTAGIGTAAKGSAAAKSAGLLPILLNWIVPISLLFCMIFGTWKDLKDAQTPRHRRLVKQNSILMWAFIIAWIVSLNRVMKIAAADSWSLSTLTGFIATSSAVFAGALFTIHTVYKWRIDKSLAAEGLREAPFPKVPFIGRIMATAPVTLICMGWMLPLATKAGDQLSAAIIGIAIVAITAYLAHRLPKTQPDRSVRYMFEGFTTSLIVIVAMLNWRLPQWLAAQSDINIDQLRYSIPLWGIDLCALALFTWISILTAITRPPQSRDSLMQSIPA